MKVTVHFYDNVGICSNISLWIGAIIAILSFNPWFGWNFNFNLFLIPIFILLRLLCIKNKYLFSTWISIIFFIPASIFLLQLFSTSFPSSIRILLTSIMPIYAVLFMNSDEKEILLMRIINLYCTILFISLIGFILYKLGLPLPNSHIDNPNPVYSNFTNYYLFTLSIDLGIFTRFSSMFIEPGHVGMMNSIILFIVGYKITNFKSLLLTITLVWTFSLAGYLLYTIGFIIHAFCISKNIPKTIGKIIGIIIIMTLAGSTLYIYDTNNPFSILILDRLDVDSSGNMSGNNRTTENFDSYYEQFKNSNEFYTGIGANRMYKDYYGTPNTSYKTFILENGVLSLIFLIFFFIIYCCIYPSKLGFGILVLLMLAFIQRPYILWPIESFLAITSIVNFYFKGLGIRFLEKESYSLRNQIKNTKFNILSNQ